MFTCDITKARSLARTSLTVKICLFTHSDISYKLKGENNKAMLEFTL